MRKFLILKGGLGNQLFQLSYFLYLKEIKGFKDLRVDLKTGFISDFKYKRKLEISDLSLYKLSCSRFISILNIALIFCKKYFPLLIKNIPVRIISDNDLLNIDYESINKSTKYILFYGYFQDSFYVEKMINKLMPIIKKNINSKLKKIFNDLYQDIKNFENSIALCVRFYEETKDPSKHADSNFGIKKIEEYNKVIEELEKKINLPFFFIFVQNENAFTRSLKINSPHRFITHDKGYVGSWERLKAQAYCKHHIFNNSTFYYWGSQFSEFYYQDYKIELIRYVSNNFVFKEIYKEHWILF